MTRKIHTHKATAKWWKEPEYKNAKLAVDTVIPRKLDTIESAVRDMSEDGGAWKRKACLDHNQKVIEDQLSGIQKKFDYIVDILKKHKDHERWKRWHKLKALVRTDWDSYLQGVPPSMLATLREKNIPSFGLKSSSTKKTRESSVSTETVVNDSGRFPIALADQDTDRSGRYGPETASACDADAIDPSADNDDDSFGPFSDDQDPFAFSDDQEEDAAGQEESMADSSSDSFPQFEDLMTVHTNSPPEEYQESFPFSGPISLEHAAGPLDTKQKKPVKAAEQHKAVPSAPHSKSFGPFPSVSRTVKRIKTYSSTALFDHKRKAVPSAPQSKSFESFPSVSRNVKRIKTHSTTAPFDHKRKAVPPAPQSKSFGSFPSFASHDVKRKKTHSPTDSFDRNHGAAPSVPRSEHFDAAPSLSPRNVKRAKISSHPEPIGRERSEELGDFDFVVSDNIHQESLRRPQAMDSSPIVVSACRGDAYSDSPCPSPRNKVYSSRVHAGKRQAKARPVAPLADIGPVIDDLQDDDSDVVFVSSRFFHKPGQNKSAGLLDGQTKAIKTVNNISSNDIPPPVGVSTFTRGSGSRGSSHMTSDPEDNSLIQEMVDDDLALTMQLINELKTKLVSRRDDPRWFSTWTLRHAFSEGNLKLIEDSLVRGDFVPCPLLMCDAGIADMDKLSLADAIQKHVIQASSDMKRKDTYKLKRKIGHLNGDPYNDCSHKCHNFWYQLWLHLCAELHRDNIDRETAGCHTRTRFNGNPLLLCDRHPVEPCQPGCCSLTNLEQIIYQWMAAKGYANFGQVSATDLKGAEDLPEYILQSQLDTYFVFREEPPYEGAKGAVYIAARATHRLGNLIDTQINNMLAKGKTKRLDSSPAAVTPDNAQAMKTRASKRQDVKKHLENKKLVNEVRRAVNMKYSPVPSNQEEGQNQQAHLEDVQTRCLDHFYESSSGQALLKENKKWAGWAAKEPGKLICPLCHTKWYDMVPKSERRPQARTDGTFVRNTIKFLRHFFNHIEYEESVLCQAFLRFVKDVPQFAKPHQRFPELITTCKMGDIPPVELISTFTDQH